MQLHRFVWLALAVMLASCAQSQRTPNAVFDAPTKSLLAHASVPVYLPAWIPPFDGPQKTLYPSATLYPQGYLVAVDPVKGCNGAGACSFLALTGRAGAPEPGGTPAALHDGTKARFYDITCGASCSAASLEWPKGGYTYEISLKGGDEATLVRVADSLVPLR